MKKSSDMLRTSHFLGTKIRNLRKQNHLTMEDLSVRCIQIDAEYAPSVSYLSMIENGKRIPSSNMMAVIAQVFQKDLTWFSDNTTGETLTVPTQKQRGGMSGMPLEPSFLFSKEHLQIAIPEMLSQTGTSGRQFAHLLIRAHQEHHQNHFPDIERAAEKVGKKQMPLSVDELFAICQRFDLTIKWFDRAPLEISDQDPDTSKVFVRSFFDDNNVIYINEKLKTAPANLKYDLATHIGHCVLHNRDAMRSVNTVSSGIDDSLSKYDLGVSESMSINAQDILHAWRDFECSFFASALLCPKTPLKQHLNRHAYSIHCGEQLGVSIPLTMRRMTAVSPYPHWHYFDAYQSRRLGAVYRGNGIPLPWGNMAVVNDPCQHWAVFRKLGAESNQASAQISVLANGENLHIYACVSIKIHDLANNARVLCVGVDINPALEAQDKDATDIASSLQEACIRNGGSCEIPETIKQDIRSVANILNISWIEQGLNNPAQVICPRSSTCPRDPKCIKSPHQQEPNFDMHSIRQDIINSCQ